MKKLGTIAILLFACIVLNAQQNCLPVYDNAIKQLSLNDSLSIAYIEKGKGETILFIHGLGGNISHWEKSITELSKHYRCIAVDLPGYGHSVTPVSSAWHGQLDLYTDVIVSFIKKKKLKKLNIAGHSMGGQIAIILALKEPSLVSKLILVAPAGFETFSETESKWLSNVSTPAFFKGQDEATIRASFKRNFYEQPADVEKLVAYRLAMKQCTAIDVWSNTVANGVKGMLTHPVNNQLNQLQQKALMVFGENDELIPNKYLHPKMTTSEVAADGAKLINNHQLVMIPKVGHMLPYEKPEALNKIINNFLSNQPIER